MPAAELTLEQKRALIRARQTGEAYIEAMRLRELRDMDEMTSAQEIEQAMLLGEAWLSINPDFERSCGLIEQQRRFKEWRIKKSQALS